MSSRDPTLVMASAAMLASIHAFRVMANNGLISPYDVDSSLDGVTQQFEAMSPELVAEFMKRYDPLFSAIKKAAADNWLGKK